MFRLILAIIFATFTTLGGRKLSGRLDDLRPFTFDDLYDSKFGYRTFYPSWVSDTEYIFRNSSGIQRLDLASGEATVIVSNEVYSLTNARAWSVSADESCFFVRTSYKKQWRHSYNGSYAVYNVTNGESSVMDFSEDIQYMLWSPVNHSLVYVEQNDLYFIEDVQTGVKRRLTSDGRQNEIYNGVPDWVYEEEMVSSRDVIYWSPNGRFISYLSTNDSQVKHIEFSAYRNEQYPEMISVAYPKAGTPNPTVTLRVYDTVRDEEFIVQSPDDLIGVDHLFSTLYWYPDGAAFLVSWLNRISNLCVPQLCTYSDVTSTWTCDVVTAGIEESTSGWIGNGGTPFRPQLYSITDRSYITAFSNSEGYWHVAVVDMTAGAKRFLTTGMSVVTSVYGYDEANDWVYFVAAAPEPRNRNVYRVRFSTATPTNVQGWDCLTCDLNEARCQWVTPSFSPDLTYVFMNCGGPDVPQTTMFTMDGDGNYGEPSVVENNDDLIASKSEILWPVKEYGIYESETGTDFIYEMYKPANFDDTKRYPLLIEVYGGPGFQKVQDRWTKRWAQTHMVSEYEIIVASFDGRGSGYRGDGIGHMMYKKLGQIEKKDTTEIARHLGGFPYIDEDRIAIWGWSYGGYTTTHTISEGSGVFKCGLAVAPLASRYYYDTIHTERYMDLPSSNVDGYEKCSILNTNLENFKLASYTIIHGTADDNVNFQNAALISKALVEAEVPFDNFFYADEAHSINTGANANQHIYKLLTKKVRACFDLPLPSDISYEQPSRIGKVDPIID